MAMKVTVIGAGNVGAAITNDLMIQGIVGEVLLIDLDKNKAYGQALDIYQGVPFYRSTIVRSGDYADAEGSGIVIITSGVPRKSGQTRLDLSQTNIDILKDISEKIVPYARDAIYIIVSNPVDILTYVFAQISGIPENRIIGTGTILDTSRLQAELARSMGISPQNVHAQVFGEHGDGSFVVWSQARIGSEHISTFKSVGFDGNITRWNGDAEGVEEFVKKSGDHVIRAKGSTYYAIAAAVCHICKCIVSGSCTALTVSTMMNGEYGVSEVCISTLNMIGKQGIHGKIPVSLSENEVILLRNSADNLKRILRGLKF